MKNLIAMLIAVSSWNAFAGLPVSGMTMCGVQNEGYYVTGRYGNEKIIMNFKRTVPGGTAADRLGGSGLNANTVAAIKKALPFVLSPGNTIQFRVTADDTFIKVNTNPEVALKDAQAYGLIMKAIEAKLDGGWRTDLSACQ